MSERNSPQLPRPRRALRWTSRQSGALSPHVVIGLAHVVLGAIGVLGDVRTVVVGSDFAAPISVVVSLCIGAVAAGALVVAGLWLADGRRRGALLAGAMDAVRCLVLLYTGSSVTLAFGVTLALGVAALWVLPQLALPARAR